MFRDLLSDSTDQIGVENNIKVGTLPLEIDLVLSGLSTIELSELTRSGWDVLEKIVNSSGWDRYIVEFKSDRDLLKIPNIYKLKAYRYLYLEENYSTITEKEIGSLIISTLKPVNVMQEFQLQALDEDVYIQQNGSLFPVNINELRIEEKNYNFLMFSTGTKKVEFLVELLDKMDRSFEADLISYTYFYYYEDLEMAAETKNFEVDKLSINIKKALDRIGLKRVIEEYGIQNVIEEYGIHNLIEEYGTDSLVENLTLDEKKELFEKLKKDLETQE